LTPPETGYRMNRMRGRLVSLVVVIVLAAAPVARALCEMSCADGVHGSHSGAHAHHEPAGSTHDHHLMKHDADTAGATAVSHASGLSASSCCADAETLTASVVATKIAMEAPVIEVTFFTVVDHRARDASMVTIQSSAPAVSPPSLKTPLRV
jgi:hypothetical protein